MFLKKPPFNKPPFLALMSAFFFAIMGITTWTTIPTLMYVFLTFGAIFGIVGVLSQTMERHRVAYEKFSRILERSSEGSEAVSGLDKVWNEYYSEDIPYAKYHTARFEGIDHKSKDQIARVEAIKRIKAIFKCIDEL